MVKASKNKRKFSSKAFGEEDPSRNPNMIAVPSSREKRPKGLLDDEEDSGLPELTVNELFAKQYEEKKKIEEKKRLEDMYGKTMLEEEDEDESEEEEDEDGELVSAEIDAQIMKTIGMIRSKKED
ncbi:hypothetical protein HDU67_006128, partial [Dinochytrium kinnereticum]